MTVLLYMLLTLMFSAGGVQMHW